MFDETQIVGIENGRSESVQPLTPGVSVSRVRGAALSDRFGGIRIMLFWPFRVYRKYRREQIAAVAAQNVYLLPLAYHLARRTGAVFAYNAHELETETIGAVGLKRRIVKALERRYIRHADVVSVVNESIADWYVEHYPGLGRPVVLTNTPVDSGASVDVRTRLGIPEGELLYMHVGNLALGRSIPLLLRTFGAIPHAHLAFLGDGQLRPEVEQAAAVHSNIHLLPLVSPDEVVGMLRGADVSLCLIEYVSLSDELSTPNKLMESLAAGVPPVSSDLVEVRRYLGPELAQTWIVDDPERHLAEAIESVSMADIEAFRAKAPRIPSWEGQVAHLVDAYERAMEKSCDCIS